MLRLRLIIAAVGTFVLAACASHTPAPRPIAGSGAADLMALQAPTCGARIFVAMGFNQNFPQQENMRIPAGDLFLNGELVDTVSKNPEISVLDVPAGRSTLAWVPSRFDEVARGQTDEKQLTLTLTDRQSAFVVLDYFDDTPPAQGFFATAPEVAIRTEVARANAEAFSGKRVVFHRPLQRPCGAAPVMADAAPAMPPTASSSLQPAPKVAEPQSQPVPRVAETKPEPKPEPPKPLPQIAAAPPVVEPPRAEPAPQVAALPPPTAQPNAADAAPTFAPAGQYYYYTVSLRDGAPAYEAPRAEGKPAYTFKESTQLNVVAVSTDRRWLRVLTPERQTVYVSTLGVTMGARGR